MTTFKEGFQPFISLKKIYASMWPYAHGEGASIFVCTTKWGIKLYELCESQSGYVLDFEIYAADPDLSNKPVDVCLCLMQPYNGRGHVSYTDNYYTCPILADQHIELGTMSVGTVCANRVKMPKDLANENLSQGNVSFRRRNKAVIVRWQDKKSVNIITTIHNPHDMQEVTRTGLKRKPVVVQNYITNM